MKRQKIGMKVLAIVIASALTAPAAAQDQVRQIAVTGEGQVEAAPDMATITLGVTNEAREAKAAMAATSASVGQVLERLTALGIEQKDIQTQRLSLNPVWSGRGSSGTYPAKITGFTASNMVMVRIRDLDILGTTLDAVIADGANDFNGLQFGVQEPGPLQDAAREAAVKDAIAKAQLLANAAGVPLGPIISITEQGGGGPRPMMMQRAAMAESSVPVAAGEVSLSASVSVIFAIGE
ncbi:SIMPL domain-containing protein [Sedimentitalea todarodis]|uniref:SIMPL domain-containing protein n=1 Tax=Sedimentitalea todarodis TaxID=1631240 RepID=A0ABU3V979_9RHOB|nr:SIMPL domain-containing protein [Sedimentitalea todarodis]MDU9002723.1 SIMPL domain-containing protein [Sedimentitalea todarodis]